MSAKKIVEILEKDYGYYFNKTDNKHQYEWILDLITDVEKVVDKSAIGDVSKSFAEGETAIVIDNTRGHGFYIGEKVVLQYKTGDMWFAQGDNECWWIAEHEANVC